MTTNLVTPPMESKPWLLTVADLAVLPEELPSGPVRFELDNGMLIVKRPPGYLHSTAVTHIAVELKLQGERRGLGKALGRTGIILWRDPDRVVGADTGFIANTSLPIRVSPEDWLETIPDLVVEVRSKYDLLAASEHKVNDYLRAGARVVWFANPEAQTVTVYRTGQEPQILRPDDTLTVEDVIPGFQMAVRDVFVV